MPDSPILPNNTAWKDAAGLSAAQTRPARRRPCRSARRWSSDGCGRIWRVQREVDAFPKPKTAFRHPIGSPAAKAAKVAPRKAYVPQSTAGPRPRKNWPS